jgi:DNA-binding response OmpR family regulator
MRAMHILVVEDEVDSAQTTAALLTRLGHGVEVAHDGARAVELAAMYEPDLVLLDLGLPDFDGYEVVHRLRQQSWAVRPSLIVAITGWAREEDRRRAMDAGFDDYLVKPVPLEALRELVGRIAARRAEKTS